MTAGREERLSQHPVDGLIRELIRAGREAKPAEIEQIIERMAAAPFTDRTVRVKLRHRGLDFEGRVLLGRADSLFYHLVKRVAIDKQWAVGTTANEYLTDLRRVVLDPAARLSLYERRGDFVAAALTRTDRVLPSDRQGLGTLPEILVVFSASRGMIVSGYQISATEAAGILMVAKWLK